MQSMVDTIYGYVLESGKMALEKNGMTIPFPQRDVHLYNNAAGGKQG